MKRLIVLLSIYCAALTVYASPADDLAAGNAAYAEGKFQEAVVMYEKVLDSGEFSWAVFYNLGNSYYKTGQISRAILNYEKALRLNPAQEDARFNLQLVNQLITDRRPDYAETGLMGIWNGIQRTFTVDGWAWISIGFFALIFLSYVLLYIVRIAAVKRILFAFSFLWLFLGAWAVIFAQDQYSAYYKNEGIIMADEITVGSEPKQNSTTLFILHSGTKVDILGESGDWYNVRFDPEKIGWMPKADLERITF